jgi:hypothetical protein
MSLITNSPGVNDKAGKPESQVRARIEQAREQVRGFGRDGPLAGSDPLAPPFTTHERS